MCNEVWTFCYMCDMDMFEKLKKHYLEHGIIVRLHGNSYRKSNNQKFVTAKDVIAMANFLDTPAASYGIPNPSSDVMFLQSSLTKKKMFGIFSSTCTKLLSKSTFVRIWAKYKLNIKCMTPRYDVCDVCEKYRDVLMSLKATSIIESVDEAKVTEGVLSEFTSHLNLDKKCCDLYINWQEDMECDLFTVVFSQNVFLPHYLRQVGPLYYLVPFRVNILGILNEHKSVQTIFLVCKIITPSFDNRKAHNIIVILTCLPKIFKGSLHPKKIRLQMDNYAGQNKNKFVMWYLVYFLLTCDVDLC